MMVAVVNMVLLFLLVVVALAVVRLRNLIGVVILLGVYSFLMAGVWVVLDAVDVAFTEAAVGAGVTTMLALGALALTATEEKRPVHSPYLPLIVVLLTGAVLIYATSGMPRFGDPEAPIHRHVAPRYIADSPTEIGIPNMVTSVLASYRGYDTLGETTVIFTAGLGILLLLRRRAKKAGKERRQ